MSSSIFAETIITWDFTKGTHGWTGNQLVDNLHVTPDGLQFNSKGNDPWIEGPPVNMPGSRLTRVSIRMKSSVDSAGELFYGKTFDAEHSVRFSIFPDGKWHDYTLMINDILGPNTRFRLDPCMNEGQITVKSISVEALKIITPPKPDKPTRPIQTNEKPVIIKSGDTQLVHYGHQWGNFVINVDGSEMAAGYTSEKIGVILDDKAQWLNLDNAKTEVTLSSQNTISIKTTLTDSENGTWYLQRIFKAAPETGTIIVETKLKVNKDRNVVCIPWLTLFPGLDTFGSHKYQGLFPGLEYLSDEPSSSKADIEIPAYMRRTPDPLKITFPMMAISNDSKYIGLIWKPSEYIAATFDSPDRVYNSSSHLMSLSAPAVGNLRFENEPCAHTPIHLKANKSLKINAIIITGKGKTVVDTVKHYVRLKGIPPLPKFDGGLPAAINLLSHGWLDSKINQDCLFRHAVWGTSFPPSPAADAAMYIDWLANNTTNKNLATRLKTVEETALDKIPSNQHDLGWFGRRPYWG